MSDDRLKKSDGGTVRSSRAVDDRTQTENRELSDNDRVAMFRQQFFQSALPDLPKLPGYHLCWLTTMNPRDSIHHRIRLGYEPVKPEDIPGWDYTTLKTGDYTGFIGVNEMLAFKLPIDLYEKYMRVAHHDMPLEEEEKLADTTRFLQQQAKQSGSSVVVGNGISDLANNKHTQFSLD